MTKQTPVNARMAGIALTAHPALKRAVNELCSVRKRTLGRVTGLVREARKLDKVAQVANRKRKATDKHEAQIRKQARTAASRDKAEETATNSLVRDVQELDVQLRHAEITKTRESRTLKNKFTPALQVKIQGCILAWVKNGESKAEKLG